MSLARFFATVFCILLFFGLAVLGSGFYVSKNLTELVNRHASEFLTPYGVKSFHVADTLVGRDSLRASSVTAHLEINGVTISADLQNLVATYRWRSFFSQRLQSISIENIDLTIEGSPNSDTEKSVDVLNLQDIHPWNFVFTAPSDSLIVRNYTLDYRLPSQDNVRAEGQLKIASSLSLSVESHFQDLRFLANLSGAKNQALHADLELFQEAFSLAKLGATLDASNSALWQWSYDGEANITQLQPWLKGTSFFEFGAQAQSFLSTHVIEGQSLFSGTLSHSNQLYVADFESSQFLNQFFGAMSSQHYLHDIKTQELVAGLTGEFDILARYESGILAIDIPPFQLSGELYSHGLGFSAESIKWLGWESTIPVALHTGSPITIAKTNEDKWSISFKDLLAIVGGQNSYFRAEEVAATSLIKIGSNLSATSTMSARLTARLAKERLPQVFASIEQQGSLTSSEINLALRDIAQSFNLKISGAVSFDKGSAALESDLSVVDLPYASASLLPIITDWGFFEQELELSSGQVQLNSKIQISSTETPTVAQQSSLRISGIDGTYESYEFENLAVDATWRGIEKWQTLKPAKISLGQLDAGFIVKNVNGEIELPAFAPLSSAKISINTFTADVFGGRVFLPLPSEWAVDGKRNTLLLRAENWQLAELVALQEGQDIVANGVLEGELPLSLEDGRFAIDKGYLGAQPPGGKIEFIPNASSKALAQQNEELNLALDLLEDFEYEVLRSDVKLDERGNLLLGLSLSGRNPKQFNGRAIRFNINLEQNLDPLLQTLRLSDRLVEKIEQRHK